MSLRFPFLFSHPTNPLGRGSSHRRFSPTFSVATAASIGAAAAGVVELSKEPGYILRTKIDGKEVGSIESKLLCKSILDLYIGEEPFDRRAKEDVDLNVASFLQQK